MCHFSLCLMEICLNCKSDRSTSWWLLWLQVKKKNCFQMLASEKPSNCYNVCINVFWNVPIQMYGQYLPHVSVKAYYWCNSASMPGMYSRSMMRTDQLLGLALWSNSVDPEAHFPAHHLEIPLPAPDAAFYGSEEQTQKLYSTELHIIDSFDKKTKTLFHKKASLLISTHFHKVWLPDRRGDILMQCLLEM